MRKRYALLAVVPLLITGCAAIGSKEAFDQWVEGLYVNLVLSRIVELILSGISSVTALLAHTPVSVFQSYGFAHVYGRVAFTALVLLVVVHGYVGLKVAWGASRPGEFYTVISRTVAALVIIRVMPVVFGYFVIATNSFTAIFASDYRKIDASGLISEMGTKDIELMVIIMSIAFAYYLFRLLMQYSWRIGSLVISHAFAPLIAVAWILPSQDGVARKLTRNILSLLVTQIAHTTEMWLFTWVASSGDGGIGSLLAQLGILQVMVSTPATITRLFEWVQAPQRNMADLINMIALTPIRGQIGRVRRAIMGVAAR